MANYTSHFTPPYEGGWENLPSENTPIDADALNSITNAVDDMDTFLNGMEQGAQANKIEVIKVNGTIQPISNKTVDLVVATELETITYTTWQGYTEAQKNAYEGVITDYPLASVSGGGGGASSYEETVLYSGDTTSDIVLSDAYTNYNYLVFHCHAGAEGNVIESIMVYPKNIATGEQWLLSGYGSRYKIYTPTDGTHLSAGGGNDFVIKRVIGVK